MKQNSKNFLFSNFNEPIASYAINKNNLNINDIYNLTTENNVIEPVANFSDFFKVYFDKTTYNTLVLNNPNTIQSIKHVVTYTYYNTDNNETSSRIFVLDTNLKLYELNKIDLIFNDLNLTFSSFPTILNLNNKLYIFSNNDLSIMIENDNFPLTISSYPNIISIVNFQNYTIFAINEDKFSIHITDKTDLINLDSNVDGYQKIELSHHLGKIQKIMIYKNGIFVIQQYGISKISISTNEITINTTCSIQSSIYPNTITLLDDYVIFLTTSGLYLFDGNDTKQIFKQITKKITGNIFKSVAYNNQYFLMTRFYINNISTSVLLQIDIENNYCTIHNIGDIYDLYVIQNLLDYKLNVVTQFEDKFSILTLDSGLITQYPKLVKFNKITFDETAEKVLSDVKIQAIGKYNIIISSENESSKFNIDGSTHIKNIGLKGQIFEIEIESDKSFMIESILFKILSSEG